MAVCNTAKLNELGSIGIEYCKAGSNKGEENIRQTGAELVIDNLVSYLFHVSNRQNKFITDLARPLEIQLPMLAIEGTERVLSDVVNAVENGDDASFAALDSIRAPLYVTDASGTITYFNPACVGFAGRTPIVGKDQWCVTWKLYADDGSFLPHSECPMAVTLRTKQPIRGMTAIVERPDGTRVNFMPFPTPLFGPTGDFVGAVNILIDVTESRQITDLRSQAARCRRLANSLGDLATVANLRRMADDYEAKALALEKAAASPLM